MIRLAIKYLLSRKRQTVLMLLGIFFGTAAYVAISGFLLGFRNYLINQLINNSAHIHIAAKDNTLTAHSLDTSFFGQSIIKVLWNPAPSGRKDEVLLESPQNWFLNDSDEGPGGLRSIQ